MTTRLISFFTPPAIVFAIVIIGYYIGRIRVGNISLDLSAILITAVLAGVLISEYCDSTTYAGLENSMSTYSGFGIALFVSSIGLSAGASASRSVSKRSILFFIVGALMAVAGCLAMIIISFADKSVDKSLLAGIFCGSVTSTPGLSAVCEAEGAAAEQAVLGYGCSYLFGAVFTVVFVQMAVRNITFKKAYCTVKDRSDADCKNIDTLILLGISIVLGTAAGKLKLMPLGLSLGITGGILCCAILIGLIYQWLRKANADIEGEVFIYRNLGLMMFFVGSGIPAGIRMNASFNIKWVLYGMILTTVPIVFGYLFSRLILRSGREEAVCVVAGGMTSTPAIGALLRNGKSSVDLSAYSMAYIGALLTVVVIMRLI